MNAYYGNLKIFEVIDYKPTPAGLVGVLGEQMVEVRFGSENGTPFFVNMNDIEIK